MQVTAAILTISDSCAKGTRQDLSGPALRHVLEADGFDIVAQEVVPDGRKVISTKLRELAKIARFVVTTGGTGISERDLTPEATRDVCERLLDGVSELMRREGLKHTPLAPLSRALCGTLGQSLILNVPGSPKGAEQSLKAVLHLVPHVLELLEGKTEHKGAGS
jgi:molybdenum cofactor synthesis domain-containing protein